MTLLAFTKLSYYVILILSSVKAICLEKGHKTETSTIKIVVQIKASFNQTIYPQRIYNFNL